MQVQECRNPKTRRKHLRPTPPQTQKHTELEHKTKITTKEHVVLLAQSMLTLNVGSTLMTTSGDQTTLNVSQPGNQVSKCADSINTTDAAGKTERERNTKETHPTLPQKVN